MHLETEARRGQSVKSVVLKIRVGGEGGRAHLALC